MKSKDFVHKHRALPLLYFAAVLTLTGCVSARKNSVQLKLPNARRYNAAAQADLQRLTNDLAVLIRREEEFLESKKAERKRLRQQTPPREMSFAALKNYFAEPPELPTNNELRGLRKLNDLAIEALRQNDPAQRARTTQAMAEVARAVQNLRRTPTPEHVDVFFMPLIVLDYLHNPVGKGRAPAKNISPRAAETDLSRIDPPDSSFWRKPAAIAEADLAHCFGGASELADTNAFWEYDEPKTSYGANPGFDLKHGSTRLKVKFGELHSEPFAARVFRVLGYNADQTDFVPSLIIKYDRRLLREFHMRKQLNLKVHVFWIFTAHRIPLQKHHDPFKFIATAVLKDGTRLTSKQLKRRLFFDSKREHPEDDPKNFRAEVEKTIDYLVTKPANVQVRDEHAQSIGPWDFGGLGHEDLREVRGAALLAAWLGWFDARFENTRLKIVGENGGGELKHFISDLGGGFGKSEGIFSWDSENVKEFPWRFTKSTPTPSGPRNFRIVNYRPNTDVPAFKAMTVDDARWMARMIARLSEKQIAEAMAVSGFEPSEAKIFTDKLVHRRDQMILDLGLEREIPLLRRQTPPPN